MKLTMLGTGNALVTECYNTCFVTEDEDWMTKQNFRNTAEDAYTG